MFGELVKIFRQLRGSRNMFAYQSTVANQLYLLFCLGGHIYFTDKIHKPVKYLWYGITTLQFLYAYAMAANYLWFGSNSGDLVIIFNVTNAIGSIHWTTLGFPLISYLYGDRIEKMIQQVDNIFAIEIDSDGVKQAKTLADAKKYFLRFWTPFVLCILVYVFACVLDMVLFFEPSKAANYLYYAWPPPLVQKYGSDFLVSFAVQCLTSLMLLFFMFESVSMTSLVLYWGVIFSNELIDIRNYLRAKTIQLDKLVDEGDKFWFRWNTIFESALERAVGEFQKVTRLIDYLRGFAELIGTIVVFSTFCYGVTLLYVCYSSDLPLVLKVKCATFCMDGLIAAFLFYWIGQNLNSLASEVSTAVYSTPWYRSMKIRQNVNVFLCQTQSLKNFAIFKVYELLFKNYSRYLHGLVSYANILLQLTAK